MGEERPRLTRLGDRLPQDGPGPAALVVERLRGARLSVVLLHVAGLAVSLVARIEIAISRPIGVAAVRPSRTGRQVVGASDERTLHRMGEQPLRRSAWKWQFRSALQARLPVLPHAAGLRTAGHRADALRRARPAPARPAGAGRRGGQPRPFFTITSSGETRSSRASSARTSTRAATWLPTRSCPPSASRRPITRVPTRGQSGPGPSAGRLRPAGSTRLGPAAPRAQPGNRIAARGPRGHGADLAHRREQRQRPQLPDRLPEGRIAWLAVHAYDLATGASCRSATRSGTGRRSGRPAHERGDDRSELPGCAWRLPAASADPYAIQFKAVASIGDGCPTSICRWPARSIS